MLGARVTPSNKPSVAMFGVDVENVGVVVADDKVMGVHEVVPDNSDTDTVEMGI